MFQQAEPLLGSSVDLPFLDFSGFYIDTIEYHVRFILQEYLVTLSDPIYYCFYFVNP